jgi:hypothetical protein
MPPTLSPEDGNRSSFRNVVFFRIPDGGQRPSNPEWISLVQWFSHRLHLYTNLFLRNQNTVSYSLLLSPEKFLTPPLLFFQLPTQLALPFQQHRVP